MAVLAGANTAKAWDQQATEAQMDNEANYRGAGAYGYSVTPHLSGAYASAHSRSHIRGGFAAPHRDFPAGRTLTRHSGLAALRVEGPADPRRPVPFARAAGPDGAPVRITCMNFCCPAGERPGSGMAEQKISSGS